LNTVGAPHLGQDSTYRAVYTNHMQTTPLVLPHSKSVVDGITRDLDDMGFKARLGGFWSSGLPYLHNRLKGTVVPWKAGLQLPLFVADVSALKVRVGWNVMRG